MALLPTRRQVVKKMLRAPEFGAADVNLITGTETSPNITQSETYTTVNPDNPNQIVVAYNDSRGRNASPSTSPAHRTPPTVARPSPASPTPLVKAPSPIPSATLLFCTTAKPDLVHRVARHGLRRSGPRRVQVHHSLGPE